MEDIHLAGLAAARAEAVQEYKGSKEYVGELMAAHEAGMERYRQKVKDTELLKDLKRKMGQNSASTVEEEPGSEDEDQDGEASSSAQTGQDGQDQAAP